MRKTNLTRLFGNRFVKSLLIIVLVIGLVLACFPPNIIQAENEIGASLLRFIVRREIGGTTKYIRTSNQPWVDADPDADIIIWAPMLTEHSNYPRLNTDAPKHVWWYENGQLAEVQDKQRAIEEYDQRFRRDPGSNIWAWGYYAFGIEKISETRLLALVYVEASCGPLCGHGYEYLLIRTPFGRWWIIWGKHLWQA